MSSTRQQAEERWRAIFESTIISGFERYQIFDNTRNQDLQHDPEELEQTPDLADLPMQPDAMVGLKLGENVTLLKDSAAEVAGLLFPFLIIQSGDDFDSIEKISAFPLRKLTKIQADSGVENPLVWLLAYKQDVYRLYGATMEHSNTQIYTIIPRCEGSEETICSHDGALRLELTIQSIREMGCRFHDAIAAECQRAQLLGAQPDEPGSHMQQPQKPPFPLSIKWRSSQPSAETLT